MNAKWWTPETLLVSSLGLLMSAVLFVSLFGHTEPRTGSNLIPAAVLQDIRDQEARCQTHTFGEPQHGPRC